MVNRMRSFLRRLRRAGVRGVVRKLRAIARPTPQSPAPSVPAANPPVLDLIEGIASSNGCAYYRRAPLRVGIVSDQFMFNYYKDAVELLNISPEDYETSVTRGAFDLILYVSGWRGLGDQWYNAPLQNELLPRIFRLARELDIPTVFQTIEDPTNFDHFLPIASAADVVLTSAVEMIDAYREKVGHDRVFATKYGVNPLLHNPIGINRKHELADRYDPSTVFFAGSWMARYPTRSTDIRKLFNGVLAAGGSLLIADRNAEVRMPGYVYPRVYRPYLMPAIDHEALQKVHKLFDFNININTVQDSLTMCAMRTVELQALGCLQLSNYALALSHNYPGIFVVNTPEEIAQITNGYSREELYRMQVEAVRDTMTADTVYDRLNTLLEYAGIPAPFPRQWVDVACDEVTPAIRSMFDAQELPEKRLFTTTEWLALPESARSRFATLFTTEHTYDEYYLQDLVNAFKYTDSDYVTKDRALFGLDYDFVEGEADLSLTLAKSSLLTAEVLKAGRIVGSGFKLDPFEVDEVVYTPGGKADLGVIVPVYDNGRYLNGRCFRSLLRSSIFDRMKVLLVDDGSTDPDTLTTVKRLARRYDNVDAYFFGDGGSGSAARPRNKGVEIATTRYVTYLDPDNEALNDGYAKLLEVAEKTDVDLAFGPTLVVAGRDPHRFGLIFGDRHIDDPKALLLQETMRVSSIQALVAKRSLIVEGGIENPEGAVGEDSLFFHELMLNARSAYHLDLPIHLYYAEREGSAVNAITPRFFERSLILEREQVKRFRAYGVLDDYIRLRLDHFVVHWYLDKLGFVAETDRERSLDLIDSIVNEYGKELSDYLHR